MITEEQLKKMPEIQVIKIINDPNTNEFDYNMSANFIIEKYTKMIHHHWWILQRQMQNSGYVNAIKEDYYDEAYEALFKAIKKVDTSRIYDEKFKLLQLASWYITNVRTKFIKQIKKRDCKKKSIVTVALEEDEDSNVIDSDVELSYYESYGYVDDPLYSYEKKEGEENCKQGIKKCMRKWGDTEKFIYNHLSKGEPRALIAQKLGLSPSKVYLISKRMLKDMKEALDYDNLNYSFS